MQEQVAKSKNSNDIKNNKNDRHEGFARGHPPYYWPRLSTLNFLDLTGDERVLCGVLLVASLKKAHCMVSYGEEEEEEEENFIT
eukprot:scaffold2320_cov168-Ochromonas_danica.AAC.1